MPSEKPTIVHVIDSLGRGGAETLLINILPDLQEHYDIILVTLTPENDFGNDALICKEYHCLGYKGTLSIFSCVRKLRSIIKKANPLLVRSQLFLSSLIARMATPITTPLVFSIHNPMSVDSYKKNKFALPLEKLTYKKRHHLVSVSDYALKDFDKYVGVKGPGYILYNYINPEYLKRATIKETINTDSLKFVAVGNLKEQKNYFYLAEAFKKLNNPDISLDIYGEGHLRSALQQEIDKHHLNITLKGKRKDIFNVLLNYDAFVMCSSYEGFGNAAVEAMAIGLPLLLSDLPVLREITHDNALFFNPNDPSSFVSVATRIMQGDADIKKMSERGIEIAKENYQKEDYIGKLINIYKSVSASA